MRVNKKQLLGFGGLAFVVGLTAIAYNLPTSATSAGGAVKVQVEVYNNNFETVIEKPLDGEIFTSSNVEFSEIHSNADSLKYYLTHIAEDGTKTTYEIEGYDVEEPGENKHNTFTLDLNNYGGWGKYIFRSVVENGGQTKEDSVQFTYAAITADQEDVKSNSEQVKFRVNYSAGVKSLAYQIFDENGNAVSKEYFVVTPNPDNGGYMDITNALLNEGINLASGKYTIIINGYSSVEASDASYVGIAKVTFDYEAPEDINVPDTGSVLSTLNIASSDFLITGLVGFSLISLAALVVIRKSHKD